jgi:hypothetical protein
MLRPIDHSWAAGVTTVEGSDFCRTLFCLRFDRTEAVAFRSDRIYEYVQQAPATEAVDIARIVRYSAEVLSYQRFEGPRLPHFLARVFRAPEGAFRCLVSFSLERCRTWG